MAPLLPGRQAGATAVSAPGGFAGRPKPAGKRFGTAPNGYLRESGPRPGTATRIDAGRPVAAICHAPWTLIEADVVRGRTVTSWPSLRTDLANAGAHWVDEQVQVCTGGPNVLITSRKPGDLPAFSLALVEQFAA
ncbi:MAG TPA: DJ-1/PfpI family protein [Actinocrinis sp.]|nr:DJ-1/PfpI family protein [Actinocrinis sp.]